MYLQLCDMSLRLRWACPASANRWASVEVIKSLKEGEADIPVDSSQRSYTHQQYMTTHTVTHTHNTHTHTQTHTAYLVASEFLQHLDGSGRLGVCGSLLGRQTAVHLHLQ